MDLNNLAPLVTQIAYDAGQTILKHYSNMETSLHQIIIKEDGSPVTLADLDANKLIIERLTTLDPTIPIVTEEEPCPDVAVDETFWLVDPLDGTKQYIARTGEFTVNIALIHKRRSVLGVIYVPTQDRVFIGFDNIARTGRGLEANEPLNGRIAFPEGLEAVYGRSEKIKEETAFPLPAPIYAHYYVASSLKFCLIAQGRFDVYLRSDPTYEWDTAAGQAIVEAAGGSVVTINGEPLEYQKPGWLNPAFMVLSKK